MADREPVLYGKYQLLERLARGGMAEVFKAKSYGVEGFEKVLVIKRILPELGANPRFVDMFINEAKIAVTLSHANIVQVFDLGRADETYFIAMEYVAGLDLATVLDLCREHGRRIPHEMSAYIVSEVAKGLDYAHRRRDSQMRPLGIVHRDVSPQNVLLSHEGEVKLTDFGIARARNIVHEVSEVGVLKGKYAYMAPEQARDEGVDARTDLFALAVVLYEMLSGTNPFSRPSAYETLKRVQQGTAPALSDVVPDVPRDLAAIVERGMGIAPDARFPDAGTLYEDLVQFLYGSRRRVGAHDVAAFLEELRALGTPRRPSGEHASLRAAFEADERGVPAHSRQTPVEVPATRVGTPGGRPSSQPRRRRRSSIPLPNAERRDVTAIAMVAGCDEPIRESSLRVLIRRFGGVLVEQGFASDEEAQGRWLVALFGARDPDGHDTESAVRCAVRMTSAAATAASSAGGTTAQLGVHAGRVLFDLSGELLRDERYDRLVGTARALAHRASAGQVLVSASAEPPIRSLFVLTPESEAGEGVHAVGSERDEGDDPGPFIGRREELRRVGEALAFAARGKQRVVLLVGDPGAGKTRLLAEVRRRLRLGGHDVGMHLAHIPRSSREVPLSGCQEMLRAVLGIGELDPEPMVREKVSRVRELGLTQPELEAVETVLGVGPGAGNGSTSGRPVRAALTRIATRLAQDRLTIFVLDGVEAVDDESAGILRRLLREPRSARILVVLSCRAGTDDRWTELADLHRIELGPLGNEDVARLVSVRLGGAEAPPELLREVYAKSGGNPLFVEEYLKALVDADAVEAAGPTITYRPDVAAVEVPKTLRGIVASRLARLDPAERNLLQVASVVGPRFSTPVLALVAAEAEVVVEDLLEGLEGHGIIRRHGPNEHAFAHELVGEVLRDGLTPEDRRDLHGTVAAALEELYPAHVDEMAERLAHHHRQAGNLAKAAEHLVRAADRLESEQALAGAIADLAGAIELLTDSGSADRDRVLSLYRRIGDLSFRSRELDVGARRMGDALELAEGVGRDDYVARFAMMRGRLLVNAHRVTEGRPWLDRARQVARQLGNTELLRDVTVATAEAHTRTGEWGRAVALFREALDLSRDTGDVQAQIHCVIPLAHAYAGLGDREHALATLEEARRLVAQHPDRYAECELYKTASLVHHFLGEHALALETATRALDLAKEYGFGNEMAVNAHNLGEAYLRLGDYKRAFANLRYSYEIAREHGLVKLQVADMRVLGFIDAVKFGSEEGRERVVEACEYAAEQGHVWDLIQSKYYLALIDHLRGAQPAAEAGYREVIRLSTEHGNRHYERDAEHALAALEAGAPAPLPG